MFDKAGVGLSDPIPKVRLLEERAAEIEAVMDAVGFGKRGPLRYERGRPGRPSCLRQHDRSERGR